MSLDLEWKYETPRRRYLHRQPTPISIMIEGDKNKRMDDCKLQKSFEVREGGTICINPAIHEFHSYSSMPLVKVKQSSPIVFHSELTDSPWIQAILNSVPMKIPTNTIAFIDRCVHPGGESSASSKLSNYKYTTKQDAADRSRMKALVSWANACSKLYRFLDFTSLWATIISLW